eukprot:8299411-Pyramimonas_sp.AAC.1
MAVVLFHRDALLTKPCETRYTLGQTSEHREHTGPRHGPPGLCAFPGRRFPPDGHVAPAFQLLSRVEKLLEVLFDDSRGDPRASTPLELERPAQGALL